MQNNPPNRKNIRWRQFDYTSKCNYFVTIDVQEKRNLFGTIVNGEMHKNEAGEMVDEAIRQLPQRFAGTELIKYIVMPNHVHLLIYNGGGHYLADMMRWLKSVTTNSYIRGVKEYGLASFYNKLWQRGYYDRVVRDQWEFDNVMRYIEENPVRWENECNASSFRNEGRIRRYSHTMLVLLLLFFASCQAQTVRDKEVELGRTRGYARTEGVHGGTEGVHGGTPLRVGADVLWQRECPYAVISKITGGKRIAVVANQSSRVGDKHLVDSLVNSNFNVTTIFCPEHGFRGKAEAGARVGDENDAKTGLPIVSLYGKNKKPTPEQMKDIDAVIFDLQDVGCRFYTYISTLHYVMEACAERGIPCIVLDRPNPNCHYVDGPVLDKKYQSFIGMHPVPIVYGLTIGEYATMINGERWLKDSLQCDLIVVPMQNYRRDSSYVLPVAPSPNLQTPQSILLYPSLCLFEGTNISVGRGTETPFEVIGNPNYRTTYMESENGEEPGKHTSFTPTPIKGVSENPPFKGQFCRGLDLSKVQVPAKFDLTYLLWMYNHTPKDSFFKQTNSFEKLAGTDQLRKQIKAGMSEVEIMLSLLIRLDGKNIMSGIRVYIPITVVGLVVFIFRITFMPNTVVNLSFPLILLLCTLWQWSVIKRHNKRLPRSDRFYSWISLVVMVVSLVMAWSGYTLMSVQVLIWWIVQLTMIQTITVIYDLLHRYEAKHIAKNADIRSTWFYDAIYKMVIPIAATFSVAGSIYWAARVFDLTEWCKRILTYRIVDIPDVIVITLGRIIALVALGFVFNYLIYLVINGYVLWKERRSGTKNKAVSLSMNLMKYFGWGLFIYICMVTLQVNRAGITLILTGLSTGIGFAMKDTLENLFYGLSLMSGRVKIGDMIECDGVRGRVTNINYQSTMVETLDGSVIAFLNSQLFSKNFKNLTKNHGYELAQLDVGVAYGSNVDQVRRLIIDRLSKMDCFDHKKGIQVLFKDFGESSVDLQVVLWTPVKTRLADLARIKEQIYDALNQGGIEIPFPQADVHIRQS